MNKELTHSLLMINNSTNASPIEFFKIIIGTIELCSDHPNHRSVDLKSDPYSVKLRAWLTAQDSSHSLTARDYLVD